MRACVCLSLLLMVGAGTGCATIVTREQLSRLEREGLTKTIDLWWYMGTSDGYHYLHNTRLLNERNVRIKTDQFPLKREFPQTFDDHKWVRLPMGVCSSDDKSIEWDFIPSRPSIQTRPAAFEKEE